MGCTWLVDYFPSLVNDPVQVRMDISYIWCDTIYSKVFFSYPVRWSTATATNCFYKRAGKTTLLWIPGHHGIAGIEKADACAKQAAAITDDAHRSVSFAASSALIRRTPTDPPPHHCRTKEVYIKTFSWPVDCRAASTRRDAVLLARLRAGHTPLLKAYANQLDTTVDPKCPSCGAVPQTVEHWLQRCPNAVALRPPIPTALCSYYQPGQRASAC